MAAFALFFAQPALDGGFLTGDDVGLIREHFLVNHPSWKHAGALLTMIHGDLYQPLPMLTFMADYAAAGDQPRRFHMVNALLHALNAVLAHFLAWRLARDLRVGTMTGVMFGCHPFAMEPVAWVTGRIILLATTFTLGTWLIFAWRRERPGRAWGIAACGTWLLALVSKVFFAGPLVAVWNDLFLQPRRDRRWLVVVCVLLAMTAGAAGLAYYTTMRLDYFKLMSAETTTSLPARVMLASRYYFFNYVWPTRLSAWSPPPQHVPLLSAGVMAGAAGWLGLGGLAWFSWRRCRTATIGAGIFVLSMLPFLAAMSARSFLTADRYMYLPIFGLHLALAAWFVEGYYALHARLSRVTLSFIMLGGMIGLLGTWRVTGREVAASFVDTVAQAQRALRLYPDDVRTWVALARAYREEQSPHLTLRTVREARLRWPDDPGLAHEAGEAHWWRREYPEAARELRRAIELNPGNQQARYYLGWSLSSLGDPAAARGLWRDVVTAKQLFLPAYTALARSYRNSGEWDEALRWYDRAIQLNPHHRDARFERALILMGRARWAEARQALSDMLDQLDPADRQARFNWAVCAVRLEQYDAALAEYDALLREEPGNSVIAFNRAQLLATTGRGDAAEQAYRGLLAVPEMRRAAALALQDLLWSTGRAAEVIAVWDGRAGGSDAAADGSAWREFAVAMAGENAAASQAASSKIVTAAAAATRPADGALVHRWAAVVRMLTAASRGDDELFVRVLLDAANAPMSVAAHDEQLGAVIRALSELGRRRGEDERAALAMAAALTQRGQRDAARPFAELARTKAASAEIRGAADRLLAGASIAP